MALSRSQDNRRDDRKHSCTLRPTSSLLWTMVTGESALSTTDATLKPIRTPIQLNFARSLRHWGHLLLCFELQREQFATGLADVAKSLRSCAQFADEFAKVVTDTPYSPETAAVLQGASESGKGKRKAAHSPEDGEGPKKRRRNIKPKDPNAPKRPASSYILFQNDVRKELKERHPNLSNSDLLGLISEQWKQMSQEQKETYNQMMKSAKAQYSQDKIAYDIRNQAESEVANAAKTPEKEVATSRVSKPASSRGAGTSVILPLIKATEVSPSSDSTDGDESEGEQAQVPIKKRQESDSSNDELEDGPETKSRSTGSVQPKTKKHSK